MFGILQTSTRLKIRIVARTYEDYHLCYSGARTLLAANYNMFRVLSKEHILGKQQQQEQDCYVTDFKLQYIVVLVTKYGAGTQNSLVY